MVRMMRATYLIMAKIKGLKIYANERNNMKTGTIDLGILIMVEKSINHTRDGFS